MKSLCAALLAACTPGASHAQQSLVFEPAPDFERNDLAGNPISLDSYRGSVVLLNFWATWCGPCRQELPRLEGWQRQLGPEGFQVIAVSMDDSVAPVRVLARQLQLNFPVVMGDDKLGKLYGGILGLPVTFLITRDGKIDARIEGETDDPRPVKQRIRRLLAAAPESTSRTAE